MHSSDMIRRRLTIAVDPISRTARVESLPTAGTRPFAFVVEPDPRGDGWFVYDPTDTDPTWRATFDAALDFNCDFMDEPNLALVKYLSHDRSSINYAQQTDRTLDALFDKQSGELDKKKRYAILREFEKRALEQAYTIPTIWWHRIIVHWNTMQGWEVTPSHYLNQDLANVWLDK